MSSRTGLGILLPGLTRVVLLTAIAYVVAHFTGLYGLGTTALGVILGVVVGNTVGVRADQAPGVRFAGKRILTVAVILLGSQVVFAEILGLGWMTLAIVVGVVGGAVALGVLGARIMGFDARLGALLGTGTGICGASAIAAVQPAVGARDDEVTYAVATVTFLGSVGLLLFPAIQVAFHPFGPEAYGVLAGATLHAVPQAVGAGFAGGGDLAGASATVTKLARVSLLGPIAIALAMSFHHSGAAKGRGKLPVEVWGFLGLAAVASTGFVPTTIIAWVGQVDKVLLVMALTALGLQTRFTDLRKAGTKPLVLGVAIWAIVVAAVGLVVRTF